jgi:methylase of polypeptide subunit release factors
MHQGDRLAGPRVLRRGGLLAMEIGAGQGVEARTILEEEGVFEDIDCRVDLAGMDRMVTARRR